MLPLVSFIVTYHNEPEAFLRACLESVQALPLAEGEAEIIVVDDGSRNQFKILRKAQAQAEQDSRFKIIRQEQAGLSVARNTGIDAASGRYIQFVDADDCLIPSAYEAVLEQVRKGSADIILFRMTKAPSNSPLGGGANPSRRAHVKALPQRGSGEGAYFLQHRNLRAAACSYAFRRDILGDLRFYPGLLHEDELFTPQLFLRANSLVELNAEAYFYRQHEGTITHSDSSDKIQRRLNDIHFIIKELHSLRNPLLERRIRQLTADYLQNTLMLTHSFSELRCRARALHREGFLPLPLHLYSPRYLFIALSSRIPIL